ncbi:MAG: hypothetical protein QNK23_05160 [Crocinitomicaceae bacterium]|nr:hypothetical protein [Crocinitomicaceae bacterium]
MSHYDTPILPIQMDTNTSDDIKLKIFMELEKYGIETHINPTAGYYFSPSKYVTLRIFCTEWLEKSTVLVDVSISTCEEYGFSMSGDANLRIYAFSKDQDEEVFLGTFLARYYYYFDIKRYGGWDLEILPPPKKGWEEFLQSEYYARCSNDATEKKLFKNKKTDLGEILRIITITKDGNASIFAVLTTKYWLNFHFVTS